MLGLSCFLARVFGTEPEKELHWKVQECASPILRELWFLGSPVIPLAPFKV